MLFLWSVSYGVRQMFFFFSSRRRHTRSKRDWSSDVCSSDLGGNALTQVLKGEARYDLTLRYLPKYRDTEQAIENIRLLSPSGERVSLAQLCKISVSDGASEVYREGNRRYVAIKYSVRGRDLGSTVEEAIKKVNEQVKLPTGYTIDWEGEYASQKRANQRLLIVLPITKIGRAHV